jgi:Transposase zinc-ribbon domain
MGCGMGERYPRNLLELERDFATEDACREYLFELRWAGGYQCPRCGHGAYWRRHSGHCECQSCRHLTSAMAGTIFQDTKLPLTIWFRAMWLMAGQKSGVSALALQRDIGIKSYKTAWTMLHKLRRAMVRPGRERLAGTVEVDEPIGGQQKATGRREG